MNYGVGCLFSERKDHWSGRFRMGSVDDVTETDTALAAARVAQNGRRSADAATSIKIVIGIVSIIEGVLRRSEVGQSAELLQQLLRVEGIDDGMVLR